MYDLDGNGHIDLSEMTNLVTSIYKMIRGTDQAHVLQEETPVQRAETIFQQMDVNSDGKITREEFIKTCINDTKLLEMLSPTTQ